MKKTEIKIQIEEYPKELHSLLQDATVYDSSSNPSMQVLYSDLGYYIKIAEKGTLAKEAELARFFAQKGLGVEVVTYLSLEKDYFVTRSAKGEDALHYLDNPEKLCEALSEAMKYLHSQPVSDIPVSVCLETYAAAGYENLLQKDTMIHGDFCLPNILFEDWKFSAFIDVGQAGAGDRHIDIYWVLWSLNFNLKTDRYTEYFLNLYGEEKIDRKILKLVAEVEASGME